MIKKMIDKNKISEILDIADKYFNSSKYDEALKYYRMIRLEILNKKYLYRVGYCYLKKEDYDIAFKFFEFSAYLNYHFAMLELGRCYRDGIGTNQDFDAAEYWIGRAYEQNPMEGFNELAYLLEARIEKGIKEKHNIVDEIDSTNDDEEDCDDDYEYDKLVTLLDKNSNELITLNDFFYNNVNLKPLFVVPIKFKDNINTLNNEVIKNSNNIIYYVILEPTTIFLNSSIDEALIYYYDKYGLSLEENENAKDYIYNLYIKNKGYKENNNKNILYDIFKIKDSNYYFGKYPQSKVKDKDLLEKLEIIVGDKPTIENLNGFSIDDAHLFYKDISYNNELYRCVYFDKYNECLGENSQIKNNYFITNYYFFKFEWIKWHKIYESNSKVTLVPSVILDTKMFDNYKNDYKTSYIRKWLNEKFYNIAFNNDEKNIINEIAIDNFNDYVWLLSQNDLRRFKDIDKFLYKNILYTDYAQCLGAISFWLIPYCFWSRDVDFDNCPYIYNSHSFVKMSSNNFCVGVFPVININICDIKYKVIKDNSKKIVLDMIVIN